MIALQNSRLMHPRALDLLMKLFSCNLAWVESSSFIIIAAPNVSLASSTVLWYLLIFVGIVLRFLSSKCSVTVLDLIEGKEFSASNSST